MKEFPFPKLFLKNTFLKEPSLSLCFKVINVKFVLKSFLFFDISTFSSQNSQLHTVSPLKGQREMASRPLVQAYLNLPLLGDFN